MKQIIYLMMLLLIVVPVTAMSPALMVSTNVALDDEPEQRRNNACVPPIDFSVEKGCHLTYYSINSVNTYKCGNYVIVSDCDGNVIKEIYNKPPEKSDLQNVAEYVLAGLVLLLIILGLLVGFNEMRKNNNDDETHY